MVRLSEWHMSDNIRTQKDAEAHYRAALETGDPAIIQATLGQIARAQGMSRLAEQTGYDRAGLYRALSADGHPSFGMVLTVIKALGLPTPNAA